MDILDRMALWGRKYEQQRSTLTGDTRFSLGEVLLRYNRNAILELTPITSSGTGLTYRPDPVRKIKVSLLDEGVSSLGAEAGEWFEVYETAASGDFARARVVGLVQNRPAGQIRMLIAQRNPDLYFREDPIYGVLAAHEARIL